MEVPYQQSPAWYAHRALIRQIACRLSQCGSLDADSNPVEEARRAIAALTPIAGVETEQQPLVEKAGVA